jgi:hypothetical protein
MKQVEDYRRHAEECLSLAKKTSIEQHRAQLLKMAETWELLAVDRERQLRIRAIANGIRVRALPE